MVHNSLNAVVTARNQRNLPPTSSDIEWTCTRVLPRVYKRHASPLAGCDGNALRRATQLLPNPMLVYELFRQFARAKLKDSFGDEHG